MTSSCSSVEKVHRGVHTSDPGRQSDQPQNVPGDLGNPLNGAGDGVDGHENQFNITSNVNSICYGKDTNESQLTTTEPFSETTETSNLYKMRALAQEGKSSPAKIEFKLHKRSRLKRNRTMKKAKFRSPLCYHRCHKSKRFENKLIPEKNENTNKISFMQRLRNALSKMTSRIPEQSPTKFEKEAKEPSQKQIPVDRMDFYYFDHGNFAYFRTTDCPPAILSELLAQQTTHYATRFWAEIFGSIHIGVTFFVTFFLQAYRFLLHSIVRPILVGFLQMTSDYFIKPLLTITFNGFLQPPLVLLYNIFSSIRDMLKPVATTIDNFLKPIANVFKSIRLVNIETKKDVKEAKIKESV